jgi:hypothetical protein
VSKLANGSGEAIGDDGREITGVKIWGRGGDRRGRAVASGSRMQGGGEDRGRTGGGLDGSYPKGRLEVVRRRGRTNVEARQEVDLRAGASGRWEPRARGWLPVSQTRRSRSIGLPGPVWAGGSSTARCCSAIARSPLEETGLQRAARPSCAGEEVQRAQLTR